MALPKDTAGREQREDPPSFCGSRPNWSFSDITRPQERRNEGLKLQTRGKHGGGQREGAGRCGRESS